ncbi:hypothetical protein HDU87_002109 [Geranomyces variabilis]|uniref:Uncharacterized protein n=1 Tax=Geranomyces variabilis TaxID=109894 RepID=A0AAD5XRH4_9FUNG|nr:hypothetical protein HDU87_002109 [Geranomyces variabilis]
MPVKTLALASLLAISAVCAQNSTCATTRVTGVPADVVSGWEGVASTPTGTDTWSFVPTSSGYVAVHFNANKCRDLSAFSGVAFDLTIPTGGTFQVSWNTRNADCQTKSAATMPYVDGAKYVSASGKVYVPFSDFPTVDTRYVEDMTLIKLLPATAGWAISNIDLACGQNSTAVSATPATASSAATPTNAENAAVGSAGSAIGVGLSAFYARALFPVAVASIAILV